MSNLEKVADELEIRNLVARLHQLADFADDLNDYLECFTEDAVWEFPGDGEALGHARNVGRKAIEADRLERRGDRFQGPGTNTRHLNINLVVTVRDDGTAAADSYWIFVNDTVGRPFIRSTGRYHDEFRKTDKGWRFSLRQIITG